MATFDDKQLGSTGKDSSSGGTAASDDHHDDVKFGNPLVTRLEKSDDDEGIESLKTDDPPAQSESDATVSHSSSSLTNVHSDVDDDTDTKDLFIKVDSPEKHTTTLEAYVTFCISTKTTRAEFGCCEYSVRRRFNDFLWLRQKLEESYPTHLVPPLPEKQSLTRLDRFNLDFVRMRQKALQKFLTRLADHPVLSFDKHFYVFLTTNASEFQSHRKEGKGILWQVTDSIHNLGASYMMRNRPVEFSLMHDYVSFFGEKMGVLDRVSSRVLKEQTDYLSELCNWGPCYVLWGNSEDQLKASLLSLDSAIDQCCRYLKELTDKTDDDLCQHLKEYVLYTECIKAVLRRRDAIQLEYDRVVDELNKKKDEREQVKISDQTYSFGSFLGKDPQEVKFRKEEKLAQQVADLIKRKEVMNDKTEVADANLKADMERWQKTQRRDVKELLIGMADRQIQYYVQCLSAWEDAIRSIQKKDEEEDPVDAEETVVHFSRSTRGTETGGSSTAAAMSGKDGRSSAVSASDDHPTSPAAEESDVSDGASAAIE